MLNQRKNDERRSLEAAQLSLLNKTIETQAARIKELESTVVTDNSKTLDSALDRIKALESLLAKAGDHAILLYSGEPVGVDDHNQLIAEIDAILPKTEEVKDEKI